MIYIEKNQGIILRLNFNKSYSINGLKLSLIFLKILVLRIELSFDLIHLTIVITMHYFVGKNSFKIKWLYNGLNCSKFKVK